ncbi:hypothetical protein [Thalassobacillus hwangdonensis]|uniref:Uncharacterized protein n=1 Tax=Thalassobacillus hwangdonensis TaxID=546108 RepID=A0ABW3L3I8_9BACI
MNQQKHKTPGRDIADIITIPPAFIIVVLLLQFVQFNSTILNFISILFLFFGVAFVLEIIKIHIIRRLIGSKNKQVEGGAITFTYISSAVVCYFLISYLSEQGMIHF